jgi:ankyrin repeat protein
MISGRYRLLTFLPAAVLVLSACSQATNPSAAPAPVDLTAAVRAEDLVAAEAALRAGADPNAKDPAGYAPLHLAAALGQTQMVELLLTTGADPLLTDTQMGATPLHKSAQSGVVDVARLLLERGAFIDQQAPIHGHTALVDAIWHKRVAMVEFLLDRGADPHIDPHDYTIDQFLQLAFGRDDVTPYRAAVDRARQTSTERDREPLRLAALAGDADAVRAAIAEGADVNRRATDGQTPLLDAAQRGHTEVVTLLLAAGADPRITDAGNMKATPAHKAGYMGHADVARLLVADPRLELDTQGPYNGYTALHDAVWHGHLETARVFVDAGARLDLRTLDGRTPLDMARDYGYQALVELLSR